MSLSARVRRLAFAALFLVPSPASAQPWFGIPADIFWTNRPDAIPLGGKASDPLVRCRTALRWAAHLHTPIGSVLNACPMLADAIEWEDEPGSLQPWIEWDETRKLELDDLFQRLLANQALGLSCPNPRVAMTPLRVYLTEDQAFSIYAAHVANAIYIEATRRVPWSILTVPREELRILLASPSYFVRLFGDLADRPKYIDPARAFTLPERAATAGDGLVCDPRVGYRFLSGLYSTGGENLIGASEEATLALIGLWMSRDVGHGAAEDQTFEHRQQYTYLTDRLRRRSYTSYAGAIMTAGCHSAASFIHDLAKSINIPLLPVLAYEKPRELWPPHTAMEHQGLLYHWARKDMRVLWHADDFYSAMGLAPNFPIDAAGRRLSDAAARQLFFDVQFTTPDVLTAHDFEWYSGITTFPERSPGPYFFSEPVIGSWRPPATPLTGYTWDKRFDLCSWRSFVANGRDATAANVMLSYTTTGPWPTTHPLESFGPRADACEAAYGGYPAIAPILSAYEAARGSNLYTFVPAVTLPPGLRLRLLF